MLRAPGEEGGTVEMIALHGAQGNSFADQTDPPNRGIISHRFPVDDLDALHAHLVNADLPIINGPVELRLPPHDSLRILTARGPCGVRLDFYESA